MNENEENETNLLINKIERYSNYNKAIKDKPIKDIFDKEEFDLIKEMPLARNIFYDIKMKIKELIVKFEDKNNVINKTENLKENMHKLIDNYRLEKQTNSDIFEFYSKRYNDLIVFNENELKNEEEKKNLIKENEKSTRDKKEEESKDESIKSSKHKGRNKRHKNKTEEEKSNKNVKEKEKNKDKNKNSNMDIE